MTQFFRYLLSCGLCAGLLGVAVAERPILRVLNWTEYIDLDPSAHPELPIAERSPTLRAFAEAFDCEVQYNEYETADEAMRILSQTRGYYDIVIVDDFAAEQLVRAKIAHTPDPAKIPNLKHLNHSMLEAFDLGQGVVGVPYLYGTTGLLYRKDFYPESIPSWKAFFDTEGGHRVSVFADHKSTFTQALLALGLDPISPSDADLRTAAKFLQKVTQSDHIAAHSSDIEFIQTSVSAGKIGAAVIYSGDALTAIEEDPNLAFTLPEEGFELYLDRMLLVEGSEKTDLAHAFVNYILTPEVHARLAAELFFASPSLAAVEILKSKAPEQLSNTAIYPRSDQMHKGYPIVLDNPLVPRFAQHLFGK